MSVRLVFATAFFLAQVALAAPDLVVQSQQTSAVNVDPGTMIHVSAVVKNVGSSSASSSKFKYYLSTNTTWGATTDTFLGADLVPRLDPGATSPEDADIIIPAETAPGTWYVLFIADSNSEVTESNEGNNVAYRQIAVNGPDLIVQSQQTSATTVVAGSTLNASCTVRNAGSASSGRNRLYYHLSNNTTYSSSDTVLAADSIPSLNPGATIAIDADVVIPEGTAAGTWYVLYRADPKDEVIETNEDNNVVYRQITVAAPDLVVQNTATSTSMVEAGGSLNASCSVKNVGNATAPSNRLHYYLSDNTTYDPSDVIFNRADLVGQLAPGATSPEDADLIIPETTPPGTWYILYRVDPHEEVDESNEGNNVGYRQITVGAPPPADLVVQNAALSRTIVQPSETIRASGTVKNIGTGNAGLSSLKYYLSRDTAYDGGDTFLDVDRVSSLSPGGTSAEYADVVIPAGTTSGTWYVLFRADANGEIGESNESNNTSTAILTVGGVSVFNDLAADHWAYPAALYLYQQGLLVPDADGYVRPAADANRAELAKLAFEGARIPPYADNYPNPFNDLQERNAETEWYYSYAKNLSYLEYGDGVSAFTRDRFNFYPSETISRAHTLKVLLETWNIPVLTGGSVPYTDVSPGHDAFDYIYTAYVRGFIDGSTSTFHPDDPVARSEVFLMLYNIMVEEAVPFPTVAENDFFTAGNYTPSNLSLQRRLMNGNFEQYTKTSFYVPGIHLPLVFEHRYDSYLTELPEELFPLRPLGHGWNHTYNAYVVPVGEHLIVCWPNGTMHVYRDGTGALEKVTEGVYDETIRESSTRITIRKKNQVVFTFERLSGTAADFPYVLTRIEERNSKSITLFYEASQRSGKSGWRRLWKVTGTAGRSLTLTYHPGSDLLRQVFDPLNREISFDYTSYVHEAADLKHFVDARGGTTHYSYNSTAPERHLLHYVALPDGKTITNTYHERKLTSTKRGLKSQVLVEFNPNYNQVGGTAFETFTVTRKDRSPVVFEGRRDGRPERIGGVGENDVVFAYDDPAHPTLPTTITGADGITSNLTYDAHGNILRIDRPLGVSESFTYNARHDIETYTDPRGKVTRFDYDAQGNLTAVTDPRLRTTTLGRGASGLVDEITSPSGVTLSFVYDTYGNLRSSSAPLGISTSATYDLAGRTKNSTDPRGVVTSYAYDANDNLLMIDGPTKTSFGYSGSDHLASITDNAGGVTSLGYNAENLLTSMTFQGGSIGYQYYEDGRLSRRTDPDGVATTFAYDDYGRLASDNRGNSYTYDSRGNLQTASNALGTVTMIYDALNRLQSSTDPFGNQVSYTYDKSGTVKTLTYPGNKVVTYSYYDDGRLQSVEDWLGNVTSYFYRADGQLDRIQYPNGITCNYSYDLAGRLVDMRYVGSAGVLASYTYTLDAAGNHVDVSRVQPLDDAPSSSSSVTMAYDAHNRIQSANTTAFTHDANGRTLSKGARTFQYDRRNLLTQVGGDVNLVYEYDALGYRRVRRESGVERRYVLDVGGRLDNVLMETDGAGNPLRYYVYGLGLISRIDSSNGARHYLFDYRGSTVAMADSEQALTHKYSYGPYGGVVRSVEEDENQFRFVGRFGVQHEVDDLYYMRARYYDAAVGRFLSVDPVWSVNLYLYADADPLMQVDPGGTQSDYPGWFDYEAPYWYTPQGSLDLALHQQGTSLERLEWTLNGVGSTEEKLRKWERIARHREAFFRAVDGIVDVATKDVDIIGNFGVVAPGLGWLKLVRPAYLLIKGENPFCADLLFSLLCEVDYIEVGDPA